MNMMMDAMSARAARRSAEALLPLWMRRASFCFWVFVMAGASFRFCFHYSRSGGEQDELQGAGFAGGAGA